MADKFARYENAEHTSIAAGPIEGDNWSGITEQSRFWPVVMDWEEEDGLVIEPFNQFTNAIAPRTLSPFASANLKITSGEVAGMETALNLSMAFMIDTDKYWVFFSEPQDNTDYIVMPPAPTTQRFPEFIEIEAPDLSEISLIVFKVQ